MTDQELEKEDMPAQSLNNSEEDDFQAHAQADEISFFAEFFIFLKENKAWWLVPILLALAVIGVAAYFSSSILAPFMYPLF